jgi:hypothetical protein
MGSSGRLYVYGIGGADMVLPEAMTGLGGVPVRLCPIGRAVQRCGMRRRFRR